MLDHSAGRTSGAMTLFAVALFIAIAGSHPSTSLAQKEEDKNKVAKELFDNGIRMYGSGQYKVAADSFREAYKIRPSWKILFNIGQAEAAGGRYGLALEAFQQYLVQGRDEVAGDRKDYVINELRRLRELVGDVEIEAPKGSVVYMDGVERGTLPLLGPILVEAGMEHEAIVVASDGKWSRKFMVWGGKSVKLSFADKDKQALAVAKPAAPAAVKPEPVPRSESPIPGPSEVAEKPPIPRPSQRFGGGGPGPSPREGEGGEGMSALATWGWVGVGVGGAVLIGGAITGGMAMSANGDINDHCPDGKCPPAYHDDVDRRDTLALVTNVLLPLGAAIAATGAVLLIVDATSGSEQPAKAASMQLAPVGAGLGLIGRF